MNASPVQLATDATASITMPISFTTRPDTGEILMVGGEPIPVWSLNEETGIWLQEGTGEMGVTIQSPASDPTLTGTAALKAVPTSIGWRTIDSSIASYFDWNGAVRANINGVAVDYDITLVMDCNWCGPSNITNDTEGKKLAVAGFFLPVPMSSFKRT